jgi:phage I-like protein
VDGRGPFENSDPDSIVAASVAKMPQAGLVVDYNHSTDLAAPEGRPSPAAGWIKQFKVEQGAIFARVEWTGEAAEALKEKKYRYVSPVFEHDEGGHVTCILRAGVTNNPALAGLAAIASAQMQLIADYAYTDNDGKGHLPIGDAAHARNALARFGQTFFESEAKARTAWSHITGACKRFGIDVGNKTMPKPKIKQPSSGYKEASAEPPIPKSPSTGSGQALSPAGARERDLKVQRMARNEEMAEGGEKSLSAIVAGLEELFPQMTEKQILQMAMGAIDGDRDGDDPGTPDYEEGMAAGADPYEPEDAEQMGHRHEEEMARCTSDGERAECAKRHADEKERFARRQAAAAAPHNKGLEVQNCNEKSRMSAAQIERLVAKHPMVVAMAGEVNAMRAAQAKARATEKVDAAIREGRLIPSQRDWAVSYCAADEKGFEKFIGAQPKIIQQGSDGTFTGRIGEAPKGASTFSAKQIEILANLGIEDEKQLEKCAAIQEKWTLKFPRPSLRLDDSNSGNSTDK